MVVATVEEQFKELIQNKRKFIENLLVVENKQRQRVPFVYNDIQADVDAAQTGMDIWIKPSSVGFSTERIANRLVDTLTNPGTNTVLVAYEDFITERLLTKVKFFYNHLASLNIPGFPSIHHDSTYEKTFEFYVDGALVTTSSIYIASARSKTAGRAEVIHHLLLDEHAFYIPEATENIIVPAIARRPPEGTVDSFCYDSQTEVLTDRGWVRFSNLSSDDRVLTKDEYGNAYYVKPVSYQSFDYNGDMIKFSGKHLDLLVTPNHSVWVQKRWHPDGFVFEDAKDAINNSRLSFDYSFDWGGTQEEWIIAPPYEYTFGHQVHKLPEVKMRMDLWLEYLGYFLSEGTLGHNIHGNSDKVGVYQSTSSECYEDIRHISKVIAGYFGTKCSEYTNSSGVTSFTICDVRLATMLEEYAKPKRIPAHILALPKEQLEILFSSYMRGDGFAHTPDTDMDRCFTVSEPLADGLQELGLKLGCYSGKHYSKHGNNNPGWNVSFVESDYPSWTRSRSNGVLERYDGKVYDVTIPTSNHLLMVRRNGKPIWSGNSTPNGEENEFYKWYVEAKEGRSMFTAHFYPWFAHYEYTIPLGDKRVREVPETDKAEFSLTGEEEALMFANDLTFSQIRWRRWMQKVMESLRRKGETRTLFAQEFPENDVDCFLATGDQWYDIEWIDKLAKTCYDAPHKVGGMNIWYLPEEGKRYLVIVDPSQGKITQSAISVLTFNKDELGNTVPIWCARDSGWYSTEEEYAKACKVSDYYNRAELVWEANGHGLAFTILAKNRRPIYFRKDMLSGIPTMQPGWYTSGGKSGTKEFMLSEVTKYLPTLVCHDIELVRQLRNFKLVGGKLQIVGMDDIHDTLAIGLAVHNPNPVKRGLQGHTGWKQGWGQKRPVRRHH